MTRDIVIFDLDGTLANIDHRRHPVLQRPKRWREFFEASVHDRPNASVIAAYQAFLRSPASYRLWILSGRSDIVRTETELCVFDDRNKVVNMWRSLGLSCFQVAEGNF